MNKSDLAAVLGPFGVSARDRNGALDAVFGAITSAMRRGEEVRLPGFGNFSAPAVSGRVGRNPLTGEAIDIPAARRPRFKAGKTLVASVNPKADF